MNVVTSFHKQGYESYGRKFLESFKKYWPKSVTCTVYYEGDFERDPYFKWIPIEDVEFLTNFMQNLHFPIMRGMEGDKYNINWDAGMARKAFIEMHSAKTMGGKVFWIDSDVITHAPVPEDFLDKMLPDDKFCCFLGRDGWYYTESGFIGFNSKHSLFKQFYQTYLTIFLSGAFLTLKGWHDCYGFDAARKATVRDDAFVNLAKDVPKGTMHPFANCELASVMDHRKGARKDSRTDPAELVLERDEPYWRKK
jgi:hypothetical protein